jgi:regulator of PEP synthase PpsR (kinase-PPPase family)
MMKFQNIYYLSGNNGILAKDMGKAIVCQFPNVSFREETIPFIRTQEDAIEDRSKIFQPSGSGRPVIISTLLDKRLTRQVGKLFRVTG